MLRARISRAARRLLCFDLENRPWAYWYDGATTSQVTAIGWKWADEPDVHTLLLTQTGKFENDKGHKVHKQRGYERFTEALREAGVVYGHNIRRHDLPMLNAQLWRLQMPLLPPLLTSDTCRDLPKRAGMSMSLKNLAKRYDLDGEKKTMAEPDWEDANELAAVGIEAARERVVSDVLLQEQLRDKLEALEILRPPRVWRP